MKKFMSILLAFTMILSCIVPGLAYANVNEELSRPYGLEQIVQEYGKKVTVNTKDEKIAVIVELKDAPVLDNNKAVEMGAKLYLQTASADFARNRIVNTQDRVKQQIERIADKDVEFSYSFTNTINGFASEIYASDLAKVKAMPNVKNVYFDRVYELPTTPQMNTSGDMIGSIMAQDEMQRKRLSLLLLLMKITFGVQI